MASAATAGRRLHKAAYDGQHGLIKQYINDGDDVNIVAPGGLTPLHSATRRDQLKAVKVLLAAGADQSIRDEGDNFPLYVAAQTGNFAILKALLAAANSDINAVGGDEVPGTALNVAAHNNQPLIVQYLLERGADVNKSATNGFQPITNAAGLGFNDVIDILLRAGADINAIGNQGVTALQAAALKGRIATVKHLVEKGANIIGSTILHHVGMFGYATPIICAYYKAGVDPTIVNNSGLTAAECARLSGHEVAAKMLELLEAKHRAAMASNDEEKSGHA